MTTKRAERIVAAFDRIEDGEPEISEDRLYLQTARAAHCEREDVTLAISLTDNLKNIPMDQAMIDALPVPAFRLTKHPFTQGNLELVTTDERGRALAVAIGGQQMHGNHYSITRVRAAKWRLLYEAGVMVVPGNTKWRYHLNGKSVGCLSEAVRLAKEGATV